jgi:hypothetical protein
MVTLRLAATRSLENRDSTENYIQAIIPTFGQDFQWKHKTQEYTSFNEYKHASF